MSLRKFIVVGWALQSPAGSSANRVAFKHMTVSAVSIADAQATYARCMGIRSEWWRDRSSSPLIVIRAVPERYGKEQAR